jgi:hypothetical protein
MSYGNGFSDTVHKVGLYTGKILKGAKLPTCRAIAAANRPLARTPQIA